MTLNPPDRATVDKRGLEGEPRSGSNSLRPCPPVSLFAHHYLRSSIFFACEVYPGAVIR